MTQTSIETSPQVYARIGGALYLIIIALGIFAQVFVRDRIIVSGDAAATAANITSKKCQRSAATCIAAWRRNKFTLKEYPIS